MKRFERIAAGVLFAIGGGAAHLALQMGYGSARFPGPGYLPFWLATLLAVTSGLYFLSRLGSEAETRPLWGRKAWLRPTLSAVIMLLFALLMGWLGFFASTFLLFLAWLIVVERERWPVVGVVSVLGTLGAYLLFGVLLRVPLPKGMLF
jgi:putative tricarboxylic transport membrane protein